MRVDTLPTLFEYACKHSAKQVALDLGYTTLSYAQLAKCVQALAREFQSVGFKPQEHVLIVTDAPLDFIVTWFALWQVGCVPIPLEASTPVAEVTQALRESGASWLVADATSLAQELCCEHPTTSAVFDTIAYAHPQATEHKSSSPDVALMFYTSGTTGTPKCVIHSHSAIAASITSLAEAMHLSDGDVVLTPLSPVLPAALGTVVLQALCTGATLMLSASTLPRKILSRVRGGHPDIFFAVPYIYRLLSPGVLGDMRAIWQHTRLCLSSSTMLESKLFDNFYRLTNLPIRSLYCSSEIGSCTFNASDDPEHVRVSVGTPLRGVITRIVDDQGQDIPLGGKGQLLVGGTHLASGYLNRPELQARVFEDGWVKTGDLASCDAEGAIHLQGRLSDTINISGYLVNPREVEQVLLTHPAIADALVYGRTDDRMGEIVAAKVLLHADCDPPTKDELIQLCNCNLIHYKVPRQIDFVADLPRSRYGKLKRH